MDFTHFTLKQDGRFAGSSAVLHQAVIAAARLAAESGRPVTVMGHVRGGGTREAVFNPDGTNEHNSRPPSGRSTSTGAAGDTSAAPW